MILELFQKERAYMMSMLSHHRSLQHLVVILTLLAIALLTPDLPCHAQDTPDTAMNVAAPADVRDLKEMLERVSYDPAEQGPLLVVAPGRFTSKRQLPPKERPVPSLSVIAAAASREVIHAGAVTALAPNQMTTIIARPGKANPFAGMDLMQPFLASLTPAQWQLAGSGRGIGMADLTSDQQAMYDSILPDAARVVTNRYEPDPDNPTGHPYFVRFGEIVRYERSAVRLRLKLNTRYRFPSADGKHSYDSSYRWQGAKIGDTERTLVGEDYDKKREPKEEGGFASSDFVYGVNLRQMVQSRLKPSQLDYAAPALNVLIPLTTELKTVGDVLTAIGQRAGIELLADQRVAPLPIYLRAAPNQAASAGDLLMALAWGITGAYRRMDDRVFLLTDDIEGIGTRYARLAFWRLEADQKKREVLKKALATARRQNPLRYLKYDAEARGALPADLRKKIEDDWTKPKSDGFVAFQASDLPASIRRDMEPFRRSYEELVPPISLDDSRVGITLSLGVAFVLPDGSEAGGDTSFSLKDSLHGMMTAGKKDASPQPTEIPAPSASNALTRGVVLATPTTAEEARKLVAAVKRSGLTEVWMQIPLKGADKPDTTVLTAAIAAGKQAGIGVYAVVSLLKGDGVGTPERNILGQDGDTLAEETMAFYPRLYANRSDSAEALSAIKRRMAQYRGWLTPDAEIAAVREKQIQALAALPGLAGITFRDTAGPGYTFEGESEGGIATNGNMGYTPAQRLAFLREKGCDPIDIVLAPDLPFFPRGDLQPQIQIVDTYTLFVSPWFQFREARNRELLGALYASLKKAHPALPLYIEDRAGSYFNMNPSWYGSWDAADRLPRNPWGRGIDGATRASKTALLLYKNTFQFDKPEEPAQFARTVGQFSGSAANGWKGLVIDMSDLGIDDVLRLLERVGPRSGIPGI